MQSLIALYTRGKACLPLTPKERALLKVFENLAGYSAFSAVLVFEEMLRNAKSVDPGLLVRAILVTFIVSMWRGAIKYVQAHADSPIAAIAGAEEKAGEEAVENQFQFYDPPNEATQQFPL